MVALLGLGHCVVIRDYRFAALVTAGDDDGFCSP
jgi:hypothetical protein